MGVMRLEGRKGMTYWVQMTWLAFCFETRGKEEDSGQLW